MARQTVVIAPPHTDGSRRTVVVRAGPPKKRGSTADAIAGVLGALLLILAAVLVDVLPEQEIILPQFQLSFEEDDGPPQPTARELFVEGETKTFEYLIEEDSITSITFTVAWEDDVPASDPDEFRIRLLDPEGNEVLAQRHANRPATRNTEPGDTGPMYVAQPFEARLGYAPNSRPDSGIIEGTSVSETAEEVLARVGPNFVTGGSGLWTIEVTLLRAGDCDAGDLGLSDVPICVDPAQGPIGEPGSPTDQDTSNEFAVTLFTYTRYEPVVTPLS